MDEIETQKFLAVVLDIGNFQNLVSIKKQLIDFAVSLGITCKIYVAHHDNPTFSKTQGESVYQLQSYQEPIPYSVEKDIKLAMQLLEMCDGYKDLVVITDRYSAVRRYPYRKGMTLNRRRGSDIHFHFVGIGCPFSVPNLLEAFPEHQAINLDQASELAQWIQTSI